MHYLEMVVRVLHQLAGVLDSPVGRRRLVNQVILSPGTTLTSSVTVTSPPGFTTLGVTVLDMVPGDAWTLNTNTVRKTADKIEQTGLPHPM